VTRPLLPRDGVLVIDGHRVDYQDGELHFGATPREKVPSTALPSADTGVPVLVRDLVSRRYDDSCLSTGPIDDDKATRPRPIVPFRP
jgi:hypothetical protein